MKTLRLSLVVVAIFFYSVEVRGYSVSEKTQKVKAYIDAQIGDSKLPGIQYIVMNSDNIIYEYINGWADIASQKPMQSNTTMMAYSQTKTITAAAVLQLYHAGKLDLEDNISLYIANLPYKQPITIRQMLSQTSGLPDPIPLKWAHLTEDHLGFDEDAALTGVLKDSPDLLFTPGKKYQYSNISYWLLGKIIEKASGEKYEDYVLEHIIKPLKVSQEELNFTIQDIDNHAKGYLAKYSFINLIKGFLIKKELIGQESNYEGNWLHLKNHYLNGPAFGGLIGTARGFGRFLQDQLSPKSVLLGSKAKKLFYMQQKNNDGELVEMTLGWHIGYSDNTKYFFKEGGGGGFHCEMRIYPDQGIASIIMVNKTNFNSKKELDLMDKEFLFQQTNVKTTGE